MPQDSALYGVARIRCHEKGLINRERMLRLADMSAAEALRALLDSGYGGIPEAGIEDTEALIASELQRVYDLVREVTPKPAVTDVFLMRADIHNLKLLIKLRLTGSHDEPALMGGGNYEPKLLKKMVESGEYKELPDILRETLEELELSFIAGVDPVRVSVALDDAYIRFAMENGDGFVKEYFTAKADFDNLLALLRVKAMGAEPSYLRNVLLSGGCIEKETLLRVFALSDDAAAREIPYCGARDAMLRGLSEAARTGRISALERERDNYLMSLAKRGKNEIDSVAPIVGYLLAKEQEARCVRLILTAKKNRLPEAVINERLRELYG